MLEKQHNKTKESWVNIPRMGILFSI